MIESHRRREEYHRKANIDDNFKLAQLIGHKVGRIIFGKDWNVPEPLPWDFYPELFEQEKESYERMQNAPQDMELYKAQMVDFALSHNNKREAVKTDGEQHNS